MNTISNGIVTTTRLYVHLRHFNTAVLLLAPHLRNRCLCLSRVTVVCVFPESPLSVSFQSHRGLCISRGCLKISTSFASPLSVSFQSHRCLCLSRVTVVCVFPESPLSEYHDVLYGNRIVGLPLVYILV